MAGTLIATIGHRDPGEDGQPTGPLRTATETATEIQRVYLLALQDVRTQAQKTLEAMPKTVRAEIIDLGDIDPSDADKLMASVERVLPDVDPNDSVHICASSGTPQLGLALTLNAIVRYPGARHWQALDPSRTAAPYLRRFDPELLWHHAEVDQAIAALDRMDAATSHRLFKKRMQSPATIARQSLPYLKGARALSAALEAADNLDVKQARMLLAPVPIAKLGPAGREFARITEWYKDLATRGTKTAPNWALELLAAAHRARCRDDISAALLGAATAYEVGLAIRLRTQFGVDPDHVAEDKRLWIRRNEGRIAGGLLHDGLVRAGTNGQFAIQGLENRAKTLALLESDASDIRLSEGHDKLTSLRNKLIHNATPPSIDSLNAALRFVRDRFSNWGWDLDSCPTAPDAVRSLLGHLRGRLQRTGRVV
jgi:hypothetical protein